MRTNCYDATITIRCVPGDDRDAILDELMDVLNDLYQLPYDYDMSLKKVGEIL